MLGESRWIVAGSSGHIAKMWEAGSGQCLQTFKGHSDQVDSVAVSSNSRCVATGSYDNTAKIWDTGSGQCLQTFKGHSSWVSSVAVSDDSRWIVTGSWDKTAKIWDASSGTCLQTLEVGTVLYHIVFDVTGLFVTCDIGPLYFEVLSSSPSAGFTPGIERNWEHALGLSSDRRWITVASEKIVWLPSDYRSLRSAVLGKLLAVGVGSGKVWMGSVTNNE
jgi:WD40 repeat protein